MIGLNRYDRCVSSKYMYNSVLEIVCTKMRKNQSLVLLPPQLARDNRVCADRGVKEVHVLNRLKLSIFCLNYVQFSSS